MSQKIDIETIKEIIMTLNGAIHPTGMHHIDCDRVSDLEDYISLVSSLTEELYHIARHRNNHRESVMEMGNMAFEYFENQYRVLPEYFEELEGH